MKSVAKSVNSAAASCGLGTSHAASHHCENPIYNKPTKLEWATFMFVALLVAFFLMLTCLTAGCASPALPGETKAEVKLDQAEQKQLSHAAAAVDAAKIANQANPDGLPKTATAGELAVADANLPPAQAEDAHEALARVNTALTGKLAEAQKAWSDAVEKGNALQSKVDSLEKQVVAERATAAANEKKANDRLCIITALIVGGALNVLAALSLVAGMYFSLPKLEYGAAGLGLCGASAFITATQVGTTHFNWLATVVIFGGVGALVYVVRESLAQAQTLKTKAGGFDAAFSAVRKVAGEIGSTVETDAKSIWHWLSQELDRAHKALVADWEKLEAVFADKPSSAKATEGAPSAEN